MICRAARWWAGPLGDAPTRFRDRARATHDPPVSGGPISTVSLRRSTSRSTSITSVNAPHRSPRRRSVHGRGREEAPGRLRRALPCRPSLLLSFSGLYSPGEPTSHMGSACRASHRPGATSKILLVRWPAVTTEQLPRTCFGPISRPTVRTFPGRPWVAPAITRSPIGGQT